jgi:hypothetical protein
MTEVTDEMMGTRLAATRRYTLMILKRGPNRSMPDVEKIIWEHGRRNMALRLAGHLAIVCPVSDGSEICGIGIFKAEPDAVRQIMDEDPGVQAGVFTFEVHPTRGFPGDALPA